VQLSVSFPPPSPYLHTSVLYCCYISCCCCRRLGPVCFSRFLSLFFFCLFCFCSLSSASSSFLSLFLCVLFLLSVLGSSSVFSGLWSSGDLMNVIIVFWRNVCKCKSVWFIIIIMVIFDRNLCSQNFHKWPGAAAHYDITTDESRARLAPERKTDEDSRARERRRHDDDSHRLRLSRATHCGVARVARNPMRAKKALHTNPRKATVEIEINGCQNFSYILLFFWLFSRMPQSVINSHYVKLKKERKIDKNKNKIPWQSIIMPL